MWWCGQGAWRPEGQCWEQVSSACWSSRHLCSVSGAQHPSLPLSCVTVGTSPSLSDLQFPLEKHQEDTASPSHCSGTSGCFVQALKGNFESSCSNWRCAECYCQSCGCSLQIKDSSRRVTGSEQQKGCSHRLTRNTISCWFLGCSRELLPIKYQLPEQSKKFSLSSKKFLRVQTFQSIQVYTVFSCFAFDPRDIPGVSLARTQSLDSLQGRDKPQALENQPFCHSLPHWEVSAPGEDSKRHPWIFPVVPWQGLTSPAEWPRAPCSHRAKFRAHFSASTENLSLNSVPRFRKTSCQEFHQSICFCKRALMNQCFLTKNSFCQKSRPAPLFSYLSLKTTVLHLQNKDKNFTLFLWSTLGSRGEQLTK